MSTKITKKAITPLYRMDVRISSGLLVCHTDDIPTSMTNLTKTMLAKGFDLKTIVEITGLTEEMILQ